MGNTSQIKALRKNKYGGNEETVYRSGQFTLHAG